MKLAKFLYWVFWVVLLLNIAALFLVPWIVKLGLEYPRGSMPDKRTAFIFGVSFFEVCGLSSAFLLWQAKGILKNLTRGLAFVSSNARYMSRAARCCFIIAGASFIRMLYHAGRYALWAGVLLEYNSLFVPVFVVAGLLCLVMSNLFDTAAKLKQDNDLVI